MSVPAFADPAASLDAYLARIGFSGERTPSLDTLRAIHLLHPQAIPFESIDPWLGQAVNLDMASLEAKLVSGGRGGYCYEHNTLLWAALSALGMKVSGLSARVLYSVPPGGGRHPRNHMLMLVELPEGRFIADVGFGGLTLTAPLSIETSGIQQTPHEQVRMTPEGRDLVLEVEAGGQWRALYQLGLEDYIMPDYEMANWYMSTHERSPFTQRLVAARPLPGRRLALANRQYNIHHIGRESERRDIEDLAELEHILREDFGIALPAGSALARRMAGLFA